MHWPFVSRKKHQELGRLFLSMRRHYYAAIDAMDVLDAEREPRDFDRAMYTLAHRIRLHGDELRFQQMADETGKQWNWVCMDDDGRPLAAHEASEVTRPPGFHQHSIKPRTTLVTREETP